MLDPQKRIVIPEDFGYENPEGKEVHHYYSLDEKLFYVKIGEVISQDECFVAKRKVDDKKRFRVLPEFFEKYNCRDCFLAKKGNRIYLIPLKEKED